MLSDGNLASVGDVIVTRLNDRRLAMSATDWVKNGDRWTVTGAVIIVAAGLYVWSREARAAKGA